MSRWILRKNLLPLSGFEVHLHRISDREANIGTNCDY